jgi:hypothetical protein
MSNKARGLASTAPELSWRLLVTRPGQNSAVFGQNRAVWYRGVVPSEPRVPAASVLWSPDPLYTEERRGMRPPEFELATFGLKGDISGRGISFVGAKSTRAERRM